MPKVLILCNSLGGLYEFRKELVQELTKQYQVYISAPDEKHKEELEAVGCQVLFTAINRRGMNPIQDMELFLSYRKLLKTIRPDVILTYTIKPNIYGGLAARLDRIPYITNITGLGTTFERGGMLQKTVVAMYRMGIGKAACVFFQNGTNRQVFQTHNIHGKKDRLVNGSGVNTANHPLQPCPLHEKPSFLFVGRLMKEKGVEEFFHCVETFREQANFHIIGYAEEDYEAKMQELVEKGNLFFHGYQTEVDRFYGQSDAVLVPSYHEGMSNVLLEAASCARPVLASNIPGCKEGIEDAVTGFLFEARNAQAMEEAISKFLSLSQEERKEMGLRGREKMVREFERSQVVQAYLEEIRQVINER